MNLWLKNWLLQSKLSRIIMIEFLFTWLVLRKCEHVNKKTFLKINSICVSEEN
jgi:predicted Co/Zn/Cd cation transporter (cation efflux family)